MNQFVVALLVLSFLISCRGDDDGLPDVEIAPLRLLSEVAVEDEEEIQEYLRTHFYNYEEFENPPENFDFNIEIDTIAGDNLGKISIFDSEELSFMDLIVSTDDFSGIDQESDVTHRLYYLSAREGSGEMPTIVDSVYIKYEGFSFDGNVFDTNVRWFDLQGTGSTANPGAFVRGFEEGLTLIKDGNELVENSNGTFRITDSGIGVVFMPSGLGYFNALNVGEPYTPIAFKIDLLRTNQADHDRDGVASIFEDLNNDEDLFNDDTDLDEIPDYLDVDDDGDGTLTKDEDLEPDTDLGVDRDGDGDATNDIGDGNPLNDDTDGDGVPNYLDSDDTASRKDSN